MGLRFSVSTLGKEGLKTLTSLVGDIFTNHAKREIINITTISGGIVTLAFTPQPFSEVVVVDGLVMAEGSNYDYVLVNNVITFNIGVLPSDGHVLVNYIS